MEVRDFAEFHTPALQRDEARYNRMLGYLARLLNSAQPNPHLRLWTLGASGQCAMQTSPRNPIILGELDEGQCRALAEETVGLDYQGVLGADPTVFWFVRRAIEHPSLPGGATVALRPFGCQRFEFGQQRARGELGAFINFGTQVLRRLLPLLLRAPKPQ